MKLNRINSVDTVTRFTDVKAAGLVVPWTDSDGAKRVFARTQVVKVKVYLEYDGRPVRVWLVVLEVKFMSSAVT